MQIKMNPLAVFVLLIKNWEYQEEFIKCNFTCFIINGNEYPLCVNCNAKLAHDSMKAAKLKKTFGNYT